MMDSLAAGIFAEGSRRAWELQRMKDFVRQLQVGDRICSPQFTFGHYTSFDRKVIEIDTRSRPVCPAGSRAYRSICGESGRRLVPWEDVDAYDEDRGVAQFVVETAEKVFVRGAHSYDYGVVDEYVWIWARRMNSDGSYNPDGEIIKFSAYHLRVLPRIFG